MATVGIAGLDLCTFLHGMDEVLGVIELSASFLEFKGYPSYIIAEYRQIAIMVGSTTIGRIGILSVYPLNLGAATVAKKAAKPMAVPIRMASPDAASSTLKLQ